MKNKQIQAITKDNKIKVFKRNKEDKILFLSYLRGGGDIHISVSKEPVTTKENGTKIYRCEIDTKNIKYVCEITEKFQIWGVESELFIKELNK